MTTPTPTLPPGHAVEIVRPGSPFLGQIDYVTRRQIQVGDVIVVCHNVPYPAVLTTDSWRELPRCTNCTATNSDVGLPPIYQEPKGPAGSTLAAPPRSLPDTQREQERRSSVVPLLLIAGVAILVAAFIFVALSGGGGETSPPPTATTTPVVVIDPTEPPPPTPTSTPAPQPTPTPLPPPPPEPPQPEPPEPAEPREKSPISEIVLYDAGGDYPLLTLSDGGTIDLSQLGTRSLNIVAETNTPVGSVQFLLDGNVFDKNGRTIENTPPYAMAGDVDGDYYNNWDWNELLGSHTIQIIPYSGSNASGERLSDVTLRFTVVP